MPLVGVVIVTFGRAARDCAELDVAERDRIRVL
jgi:hypothetical protein